MSNYQVAELKWENGQLAMHGLGGILPTTPTKLKWGRSNETLESIVHQATYPNKNLNFLHHQTPPNNMSSVVASSGRKCGESSSQAPTVPTPTPTTSLKKQTQSDSDQCGKINFSGTIFQDDQFTDRSACASASATFGRDNDTTMITWASYESPRSLKIKKPYEDSACQDGSENRDEDREIKGDQTGRSHSSRQSRAAAVHNQSERRRRDRINQKMKTLQKLVPNANKTDKASMLDEVINYVKQLQAQVQIMSMRNNINSMPQMMMQQQLQMSLLARMAAGMGMGMLDVNTMQPRAQSLIPPLIHPTPPSATPAFLPFPPSFVLPHMNMAPRAAAKPNNHQNPTTSASVPLPDPAYCAFLAQQAMNLDHYNKMAALYQQQFNQTTQTTTNPSQSKNALGD